MKTATIGLLGFGNIGGGVYRLLTSFHDQLLERTGVDFRVKRALVKAIAEVKTEGLPEGLLTEHVNDVLEDPDIEIVCEFLGGEHPAADWMLAALNNGKSVVTANKVALSLNWHKLEAAAKENGVGLYYEAAVGGAIPIIAALKDCMQSSEVSELMGIVNGTTNYILSRMTANHESYDVVLKDAQRLGLAEPNPATDVEGLDAAYKLSILASLAFHTHVPYARVYHEGITNVSPLDIASGRELGYTLKLLAIGKRSGDTIEVRVHPAFLPDDHPLSAVNGSFNAVWLLGHACREMTWQGRGAGDMPTASAVVSDIIRASTVEKHAYANFDVSENGDPAINYTNNWSAGYYVRLSAVDEPGVLSKVTGCFAAEGVSIHSMMQKPAAEDGRVTLLFITHKAKEQAVQTALRRLDGTGCFVQNMIRVEG